jgi:hypothetical protein
VWITPCGRSSWPLKGHQADPVVAQLTHRPKLAVHFADAETCFFIVDEPKGARKMCIPAMLDV